MYEFILISLSLILFLLVPSHFPLHIYKFYLQQWETRLPLSISHYLFVQSQYICKACSEVLTHTPMRCNFINQSIVIYILTDHFLFILTISSQSTVVRSYSGQKLSITTLIEVML